MKSLYKQQNKVDGALEWLETYGSGEKNGKDGKGNVDVGRNTQKLKNQKETVEG